MDRPRIPPGQQLAATGKWPLVGERTPAPPPAVWTLEIAGLVHQPGSWTLEELEQFPVREFVTDIHCVTRWSRLDVAFRGVLLADLLESVGLSADAKYLSFQSHSTRSHSTSLPLDEAVSLGTFLAWECDGRAISSEHGGPLRTIVPGRYFYKSLKWLRRIEVLAEDRLGYWEAETGYHNGADPWLEQRYAAANLKKAEIEALLATRDFSGRDLRSIELSSAQLAGLKAVGALLRDARFRHADLSGADFSAANLSNAQLFGANLRGASFRDGDVEGADFTAADLRGADFRGASLFGASLHTEGAAAAQIDATTRFSDRVWDQLTPEQAAFLQRSQATISAAT